MIAALYVATGGCYFGLEGVDPWDEKRDARKYSGPWPVVAHPPCERWCRLAGLVEKRWGYRRGEDDGCFSAAVSAVRAWGGILEHPAYSDAWPAFNLPRPNRTGGWTRGRCGGWSCHVEQSRYGHAAKKATWLYAFGISPPVMRWGYTSDPQTLAWVSWCGNHTRGRGDRRRLGKREAKATTPIFRDVLLSIARTVPAQLCLALEAA